MTTAFTRGLSHLGLEPGDSATIEVLFGSNVRTFEIGQHLVQKGEQPVHAYLILEGWALRYKLLPNWRRQIIGILIPGDLSDLNLFFMPLADHSIACLTPLTAIEVSQDRLNGFFDGKHPRIAQALWAKTFLAMCVQREWTVNLGKRSAPERIGHILCELFYRLHAIDLTVGHQYPLPLTQGDLADAAGLSLVHTNKRLQDLRAKGLIAVQRKFVTILDLKELERASLFSKDYLHLDYHFSGEGIPDR